MSDLDDLLKQISESLETKITLESSVEDTPEWDSLGQLTIIMCISKFTNGESDNISGLSSSTSMRDIITLLTKNNLLSQK